MPWFPWPDYIKKKACRYLLQHYVGSFLEEKLSLDQLSVDLYSGTGTVEDVKLDVWAINENLEALGAPIEVRDGRVGSISVSIPWSALLTASSKVEIKNMKLTLQPKYREDEELNESNLEALWSSMSMTASMKLAEDCLKQNTQGEQEAQSAQPFEGPELLAQTIESVLTRIEVSLIGTVIRLEHVPQIMKISHSSNRVVSLEMHIELLKYYDEMGHNSSDGSSVDPGKSPIFQPAAILHKHLQLMGVTLHLEEYPEDRRHHEEFSPVGAADEVGSAPTVMQKGNIFGNKASSPEMPPLHNQYGVPMSNWSATDVPMLCKCKIGEVAGKLEVTMKIKQNEHVQGPKAEVEMKTGSLSLFLSPKQIFLLSELGQGFLTPAARSQSPKTRTLREKRMTREDYQRIEGDLQDQRVPNQYSGLQDGLHSDDEVEPLSNSEYGVDDMFYSMSKSNVPSTIGLTGSSSNDMESSITSTLSSASTDTTQTGTSFQSYSSSMPCGYSASYQGDCISKQPRSKKKKVPTATLR